MCVCVLIFSLTTRLGLTKLTIPQNMIMVHIKFGQSVSQLYNACTTSILGLPTASSRDRIDSTSSFVSGLHLVEHFFLCMFLFSEKNRS